MVSGADTLALELKPAVSEDKAVDGEDDMLTDNAADFHTNGNNIR